MDKRMLSPDIASKMLSALMDDNSAPSSNAMHQTDGPGLKNITTEDQKRYLKKYIDNVGIATRRYMAQLLVESERREIIKPCSEGVVVNLDILTAAEVRKLYDALVYERERRAASD